jgi:hypothetical protein
MSFTVEEEKPLVEDFLSVDQPVPGQNFCCMSFVSPEKVIRRKQMYLVKEFLKDLFTKHEDKVVPESSAESHQKLASEQREVIKKIRWDKFNRLFEEDFPYESVNDLFDNYCVVNEDKVNNAFDAENNFQTSVRGLKIRGTYDTRREAEVRAEVLRRKDPNFNVFIGQVGYWLPWDPEASQVDEQVDQEQQLNELVKRYQENKERVDEEFQRRKEESLKKAKEENERRKAEQAEAKAREVEEQEQSAPVETGVDMQPLDVARDDDDEELPGLTAPDTAPAPVEGSSNGTGIDSEEVAKEKLAEMREILKAKDSGYATMMGQKDPWVSRKEQREREEADKAQELTAEDTEKELSSIASNIF